jgi:CDP-diacylglycerol--glycerol-3-phosphate 3-phosphatidyltransferase
LDAAKLFNRISFSAHPVCHLAALAGKVCWRRRVVLLTSFTDALDGAMARTRNQVTSFGKMFDPLADKILISTVVYILVLKYIDPYAAWTIIILEAIIIAAAIFKRTNGDRNMQANIWGKIKMNLQVLGVVILLISILFNVELLHPVSQGTFYLAIAFAILSLFTYSI